MRTRTLLTFLLVLGVTAALTPMAQAEQQFPRIASHNVFLFSKLIYPNWGQDQRADLLDSQAVLAGQDVVVLQEAFDNSSSERLFTNLSDPYPHRTPVVGRSKAGWDTTRGDYTDLYPEDGGVAILSRWPITERVQHVYKPKCGTDALSAKGFAHAKINSPTGPVHVLGTHLQADDGGCNGKAPEVRAAQLAELAAYIRERNIPASEPVIVAGDLNVVLGTPEHAAALVTLNANAPAHTGHPYSYDPQTNSIAKDRDATGPRQQLDYVLLVKGHRGPANWVNETRAIHSPKWTVKSWGKEHTYTDYSDHYPVFATGS
ncbi:sphingomyelin phosphodiesterase [Crossiella sp. SN42]|uniref:sphingomyelin phosphodiesterase n=1 Tax=Crossiella sp. SN42 TaxID=2944808 RepID=UPI00207C26FE|nr:sphingomyelin phosphodiesterase [Crossiella sp. SN42]MCO1580982.1 sphingomyelin phosphodiesterase [Crossiella sp. SN42]